MNKHKAQLQYEKWWLGKLCRPAGRSCRFNKVIKVTLIGSPSFVYGLVKLTTDQDEWYVSPTDSKAFKPRKKDIEVQENPK